MRTFAAAVLWLLSARQSEALELQRRGILRPRIAISMVSSNKQAKLALQRYALTAAAAVTILSQGVEPSLAGESTYMLGVMPAFAADGGAGEQACVAV